MCVRNLSTNSLSGAQADIRNTLTAIRDQHQVSIPWAIESGSRAWGFPSPDSDYDCRFVFVRPISNYVSLWPRRDVIEVPPDGDLDVNGWELGKAIKLLLKGNAVIIEWLRSPMIYCGDAQFQREFLAFFERFANRDFIGRHYLHLGERQRRAYFGDGMAVPLKKIFYVLRPAAVLRWLRFHPATAIPPMHLPTLMQECDPPRDVVDLTEELMARKAVSRELGTAPLAGPIAAFMDHEFDCAGTMIDKAATRISDEARFEAEAFFRRTVARLDTQCGAAKLSVRSGLRNKTSRASVPVTSFRRGPACVCCRAATVSVPHRLLTEVISRRQVRHALPCARCMGEPPDRGLGRSGGRQQSFRNTGESQASNRYGQPRRSSVRQGSPFVPQRWRV